MVSVKLVRRKNGVYQLRWTDPLTNKVRQRSTGTTRRKQAEELRVRRQVELEAGHYDRDMDWDEFRLLFEEQHMSALAASSRGNWRTAVNTLERLLDPSSVAQIDARQLLRFATALRAEKKSEATIASYIRWTMVAMRWAADLGLIDEAPRWKAERRSKGRRKSMRSRPVTPDEFGVILAAVQQVRPHDANAWKRFLRGLYHSGFRIAELLRLSWEPDSDWYVDTSGSIPCVRIFAEGQKRHTDEYQPITPQMWELLQEQPPVGLCFPLMSLRPRDRHGAQLTDKKVMRVVSDIGKASGVVTDPSTGKTATSHDIGRRAFATRMSAVLSLAELADWMRHASPSTTLSYYTAPQVEQLSQKVWNPQEGR